MPFTPPAWLQTIGAFLSKHRRLLNNLFNAAILVFVLWQLSKLGFGNLLSAFPRNPWFYLVYVPQYAALPVSEMLIFRIAWPAARRASMAALLRKRAMNAVVLGYSGDVWFFLWARTHLRVPAQQIALVLKDSALLSAAVSVLTTVGMTIWLVSLGSGGVFLSAVGGHWRMAAGLAVAAALLAPLAFRLRHRIFTLPPNKLFAITGLHVVRLFVTQVAQVAQWMIVLPVVPFHTWLLFMTVQMLIQQMPFVPNRDLLFLAIGVQITKSVGVDHAALVSMFLAVTVVKQAFNYVTLAATTFMRDDSAEPAVEAR